MDWLLNHQGANISDRAPVVALCANIVKDAYGVAELKLETRTKFRAAVEATLDAFRFDSGIPATTQLEILEALGQLGAVVKGHLITATKSGLFQVRRRALEMLLPHLSDDELFAIRHILSDRSKEPIKSYILAIVSRDAKRASEWLQTRQAFPEKATEAFTEILWMLRQKLDEKQLLMAARAVFEKGSSVYSWSAYFGARASLLKVLDDETLNHWAATNDREAGVRVAALDLLFRSRSPKAAEMLVSAIRTDHNPLVRWQLISLLVEKRPEEPMTWELLHEAIRNESFYRAHQITALDTLVRHRHSDAQTWEIIRKLSLNSKDEAVRIHAMRLLDKYDK